MSAGAVRAFTPQPAGMPQHTGRPPLHLVVSSGRVIHDESAGTIVRVRRTAPPALRLTRRGRVVVALMTSLVAGALALVLAGSVDAAGLQVDHAATVSADQTLSEVAASQLPSLPITDAVARIQLLNALSSSQVHEGQSLLIPAVP